MPKSRHIRIRGVHKEQPDVGKLSRALIALAQAQAEKEAQEQQERPEEGKADHDSPRRSA
jgi:hypothetical protein